jgi:serine/threonine protein phosphatase PrpC
MKTEMGAVNADVAEEAPWFLGICDGVSEVQKLGISPEEFPADLLARCREALEERESKLQEGNLDTSYPSSPSWMVNMIRDAYRETKALGSTTLLMTVIEENNRLLVANLGDCCMLLLRRNRQQPERLQIAYKSEPTRFEHNRPFQIVRLEGVEESQIIPVINSTRVDTVAAQHGDLVILGSDGIFDNLHDEDILQVVAKTCPVGHNHQAQQQQPVWGSRQPPMPVPSVDQLKNAADMIVQEALDGVCAGVVDEATGAISWPPNAKRTPAGLGGKADDTTVVVAAVVQVSDPAAHDEMFYRAHPNHRRRGWFEHGCCGGQGDHDRCRCS